MRVSAQKVRRRVLVLSMNGLLLIYLILMVFRDRAADRRDWAHNFQPSPLSLSQVAWMIPLAVGIILELTTYRAARVFNVGWYATFGLYMIVGFVLATNHLAGLSEPEHWLPVVIFAGIPSLAVAVLLNWLYRTSKPNLLSPGPPDRHAA
jgi:hypothetical protein